MSMQSAIERAVQEVALRPQYLQYIELVKCLQLLGVIRPNYEQDLDEHTMMSIQRLWNDAGGASKLLIEANKVIPLIADLLSADSNPNPKQLPPHPYPTTNTLTQPHQTSLSSCSNTGKLSLTLKTRNDVSTRSIYDWSSSNKQNLPGNNMNSYVARRVHKICSDFKKTSQKVVPLCSRDLKKYQK